MFRVRHRSFLIKSKYYGVTFLHNRKVPVYIITCNGRCFLIEEERSIATHVCSRKAESVPTLSIITNSKAIFNWITRRSITLFCTQRMRYTQ